tara:strand:+ start:1666 stop:1998 length:333 start_codon:yes stop_codon:yes gene_type:complete
MRRHINISGIDKIVLLRALWKKQNSALFYAVMEKEPPVFDSEHSKVVLQSGEGYVDYVCGRRIKTYIGGDEVDPTSYDDHSHTGPGSFEKIVAELRNDELRNNEIVRKHD